MSLVDTQTDEGGLRQQLQLLLSLQELINELEPRTVLVSELEEALRPSEELGPQIASLETEIGLRSAQIADLQRLLLGVGGSEERGHNRWDTIATIVEANCALLRLLVQLVAARASEELREAREERDAVREERERLTGEIGRLEVEHQDKGSSRPQSEDQQRESLQFGR
ncbi:unnamed protein product [Lampetra planeri]